MKQMVLNRQQILLVSAGGIVLIGLMLLRLYLPLGSRLKQAGKELAKVQSELSAARETLGSVKATPPASLRLPGQEELSSAIEEMTVLGKELGIDFRSIRPQSTGKSPEGYPSLPIEMQLESFYRELGFFMGSLKELEKSAVTVESFEVRREEGIFPKLRCHLLVKMAVRP